MYFAGVLAVIFAVMVSCGFKKVKSFCSSMFCRPVVVDQQEMITRQFRDARDERMSKYNETTRDAINLAFEGNFGDLEKNYNRSDRIVAKLEKESIDNEKNRLSEVTTSSSKKRQAPKMPSKWWSTSTLQAQALANAETCFQNNSLDAKPESIIAYDDVPLEGSEGPGEISNVLNARVE